MKAILLIAVGSGIGGVLRYGMQTYIYRLYPFSFPLGTFAVNILGCFLIGLFAAIGEKGGIFTPAIRLFLTTGLCGGFTTFSTFSIDNIALLRSGEWLYFLLYAAGSVVLGILAVWLGMALIRII